MFTRLSFALLGFLLLPLLATAGCPLQTALSLGSPNLDRIFDADLDPEGRLVVTGGFFADSLAIPGLPTIANAGDDDAFLAVFDSAGNPVWAKGFGFSNAQLGLAVATDMDSNIIMAGLLFGSVDFGGGVLSTGGGTIFLAKFDAAGNHIWSQLIPSGDFDFVHGLATSPNGDIVMLADTQSPFIGNLGGADIRVARYAADGTLLAEQVYGTNEADAPGDIAITADGDLILTGTIGAAAEFGTFTTTHVGEGDAFVAKIDTAGTVLWVTTWGGSNEESPNAVAVAPDGSVYFGGDFGSADAPGLTGGPYQNGFDWFCGRLSATGSLEWIRNGGGLYRDGILGLDVSATGDVVITGSTQDNFVDDERLLVARYTSGNSEVFHLVFKEPVGGADKGVDVVVDANDDMIVVGDYEGILDLCSQVLTSAGDADGFIMRISIPDPVAVPPVPTAAGLDPNYPNPFNPQTTIRFRLSVPGNVRIDIFDTAGHRVRRLLDARQPAGESRVEWNGCDDEGRSLASGVYRYRLVSDTIAETRSMVLVR